MSRGGKLATILLAGALCAPVLAAQRNPYPAASIADCNGPDWQTTLAHARNAPHDARAYWLDRRLIQWPGASMRGHFKLYHAADASLDVRIDEHVGGADEALALVVFEGMPAPAVAERFGFIADGPRLALRPQDAARLQQLIPGQWVLAREDDDGRVLDATTLQSPGALDDLYAEAAAPASLGVRLDGHTTQFQIWAPTAGMVSLCRYAGAESGAVALEAMRREASSGVWVASVPRDISGGYYTYLVDVFVPGIGIVRNRVTDPYSISLNADSRRSYIARLDDSALQPSGWSTTPAPDRVRAQTDMVIYELHVRDFSIDDASVPESHRGKYLAFTDRESNGMRHLRALSDAGVTDVHLLPVFDIASVPERDCITPRIPTAAPDSERQQAAVMAVADRDCFNWGYDPWHYSAPEGSYASDPDDGAARIRELRGMVQTLHAADLRVGMDVVYNHTSAAGQAIHSVLDRIVPGYYQRMDARGDVETSTCCANTATEHAMMAKLMIDSVVQWARDYRIDSFRFDLMSHQPRAVMERLQARVDQAVGHHVNLIGEGWNFGEIADGKRFVQASQLSLNGSGIATFSDRTRDALRGGSAGDSGQALVGNQGWLNGLAYAPNASNTGLEQRAGLRYAADLVRVGLAGSLRDYRLPARDGKDTPLSAIDYNGQPAGYVSEPGEVVNYVENHDNQTLFDINAMRLPRATSGEDRARVQLLGAAVVALSQGIAYYHAGIDTLRSKSLDRNSYDSGDWFNRLDWTYRDNGFGSGLPPKPDNGKDYALLAPVLADADIKPTPANIAFMRDGFRDLLRIRASTTLLRMRSAADIKQRLQFIDSGSDGTVIAAHIDDNDYPGAGFTGLVYVVNADTREHAVTAPEQRGKSWRLHPAQRAANAADRTVATHARFDPDAGTFTVPARSAVVFVLEP